MGTSMPRLTERHLTIQLHELLMFLGPKGVATVLVGAQDAVILLRYLEANGEVRTTISVMNTRGSAHERTLREFRLDAGRISVGKALRDFRGVLTGVPTYDSSYRHSNDPEEL